MNERNVEAIELHACVDFAMEELTDIWNFIGISGDPRISRRNVVLMHLKNLLDEMVSEEKSLRDTLVKNTKTLKTEVAQLCIELDFPKFELSEGLTLLQTERELKRKVDILSKEKDDRLKKLKILIETDEKLSEILATTTYEIRHSAVPTLKQLEDFQTHIHDLEEEKARRFKKLMEMQKNIVRLLDELELSPNTSFERNVVCEFDILSLTDDNLCAAEKYTKELETLHDENLREVGSLWKKIEFLWKKLEIPDVECQQFKNENRGISQRIILSLTDELGRCEKLKLQNIRIFVYALRSELTKLWDKCYFPNEARAKFTAFFEEEEMSEELMEEHEREMEKMKEFYEENKEMLELVSRRENLWKELLDLETPSVDRLTNRGGQLLKEEKRRNKVNTNLPKVEQDVLNLIRVWEKERGKEFLIGGMRYEDFIKKQREDHYAEKENEKLIRKAKQTEESAWPTTPGSKRFAGTPSKTPNKFRKVETPTSSRLASAQKSKRNIMSPAPIGNKEKTNTKRMNIPHSGSADLRSACSSTMERAMSIQTLSSTKSYRPPKPAGGSLMGLNNVISTTVIAPPPITTPSGDPIRPLCPVGHYEDFANGLNKVSRNNSRSTLVPKPPTNYL